MLPEKSGLFEVSMVIKNEKNGQPVSVFHEVMGVTDVVACVATVINDEAGKGIISSVRAVCDILEGLEEEIVAIPFSKDSGRVLISRYIKPLIH